MSDTKNKNETINPINEDMPKAIPLEDDALDAATGGITQHDLRELAAQDGRKVCLGDLESCFRDGKPVPGTDFDCSCPRYYKFATSLKVVPDSKGKLMHMFDVAKCYSCLQERAAVYCYLT